MSAFSCSHFRGNVMCLRLCSHGSWFLYRLYPTNAHAEEGCADEGEMSVEYPTAGDAEGVPAEEEPAPEADGAGITW